MNQKRSWREHTKCLHGGNNVTVPKVRTRMSYALIAHLGPAQVKYLNQEMKESTSLNNIQCQTSSDVVNLAKFLAA
jgi:hypothetical protein